MSTQDRMFSARRAAAQRRVVKVSWWADAPRKGFTAHATAEVGGTPPVYNRDRPTSTVLGAKLLNPHVEGVGHEGCPTHEGDS